MNALAPDYILSGLIERGLPQHIAQGFVMNARHESGLNPGINEQEPVVPGSRGGWGLFQWTGPRRRQLEAYAAQRGVAPSDPEMQMDFLLMELQGSERGAWDAIQQSQTAGEAGAAIVNSFLRPAEAHRARREAQYLGGAPMPSGGQSGAPSPGYPQNALAYEFAPLPQVDYAPLIEAEMQQAPQQQFAEQAPIQMQDPQMNRLAAAMTEYVPQFDTTYHNTRRLRG